MHRLRIDRELTWVGFSLPLDLSLRHCFHAFLHHLLTSQQTGLDIFSLYFTLLDLLFFAELFVFESSTIPLEFNCDSSVHRLFAADFALEHSLTVFFLRSSNDVVS
jgi:hypothetical protein